MLIQGGGRRLRPGRRPALPGLLRRNGQLRLRQELPELQRQGRLVQPRRPGTGLHQHERSQRRVSRIHLQAEPLRVQQDPDHHLQQPGRLLRRRKHRGLRPGSRLAAHRLLCRPERPVPADHFRVRQGQLRRPGLLRSRMRRGGAAQEPRLLRRGQQQHLQVRLWRRDGGLRGQAHHRQRRLIDELHHRRHGDRLHRLHERHLHRGALRRLLRGHHGLRIRRRGRGCIRTQPL